MNFVKRYPLLFALNVLSCLTVVLVKTVLAEIPEKWKYGYETGEITFNISIGYISSYIFYYLVVYLKEERDRKNVSYRISSKISFVILSGYSIYSDILICGNSSNKIQISEGIKQLDKFCKSIHPLKSHVHRGNISWFDLLRDEKKDIERNIKKINNLLPYLDSELVGLITQIEDSFLFVYIDKFFPKNPNTWNDISQLDGPITSFLMLIIELEEYFLRTFPEFPHKNAFETSKYKYL